MSLEFTLNHAAPVSAEVDCVIVGAYSDKTLSPAAQALDAASGGRLAALVERGDVGGKTGNTTLLHDLAGERGLRVSPIDTSLEDVFVYLMRHAKDNFGDNA